MCSVLQNRIGLLIRVLRPSILWRCGVLNNVCCVGSAVNARAFIILSRVWGGGGGVVITTMIIIANYSPTPHSDLKGILF